MCTSFPSPSLASFPLQVEDLYQEAEPIVASGITAALQMATRKGFFEEGKPCACPGAGVMIS